MWSFQQKYLKKPKILEKTRLASPFFMNVSERANLGDMWAEKLFAIDQVLSNFNLPRTGMYVEGTYFEPMTYLLRYQDVLDKKMNPVNHFKSHGKAEGRSGN